MSKKDTAQKSIDSMRKTRDRILGSEMEKMPKIRKPDAKYPGKVGHEKPIIKKPASKIVPIKPPPQTRAIEPAQKEAVVKALVEVWLRYPYLTLGQLLVRIGGEHIDRLEDLPFAERMRNYNPPHIIECGSLSPSRAFACTLEKGHADERHFSRDLGFSWKR